MPPIRSNTNPTGLGTIDDYVERTSTLIFDFAGKTSAAKRVFNVIVRRTYNPLLGIRSNWLRGDRARAPSSVDRQPEQARVRSCIGTDRTDDRRDPHHLAVASPRGAVISSAPARALLRFVQPATSSRPIDALESMRMQQSAPSTAAPRGLSQRLRRREPWRGAISTFRSDVERHSRLRRGFQPMAALGGSRIGQALDGLEVSRPRGRGGSPEALGISVPLACRCDSLGRRVLFPER